MKAEKLTEEELLEQIRKTQLDNQKYIFQWPGNDRCKYNIGDYFSNYLLDKLYDKALLDDFAERKQMVLIGTQLPVWITRYRLYCGVGLVQEVAEKYNIQQDSICYVRGKITRDILVNNMKFVALKNVPMGDNGILASLLYAPKKKPKKKYDVGIVLHWSQANKQKQILKEAKKTLPGKKVQVRCMSDVTCTCEDLFDFIMSCKVIVSSSLHGIIFAHSFGVPALCWHVQVSSKFKDYYSVYDGISYDELNGTTAFDKVLEHTNDETFISKVNPTPKQVHDVQRNILNALPYKNCLSSLGKSLLMELSCDYLFLKMKGSVALTKCSSGGVVPVLYDEIRKEGGHCFGVKFNESFTGLEYVEVDESNIDAVLGAKYLDVEISDGILKTIRNYLDSGEKVLVVGRPCQCHLLRMQLRNYPNLILVEIMCGGVPKSNDLWNDYIGELKKEYGDVYSVNFRAKNRGWNNYSMLIEFIDGTVLCESHKTNQYLVDCQKLDNLNPKCVKCPFGAKIPSQADITCGDAFGMEYIGKNDDAGTSIAVLNTDNGRNIIKSVMDKFECDCTDKSELTGISVFNRGIRIQ